MSEIPDEVKQQALDAVQSIRGMVKDGDRPENEGFSKGNSSYQTLVEGTRSVVDAYDSQGMAAAREQQRTNPMERDIERQQEPQHGRDL